MASTTNSALPSSCQRRRSLLGIRRCARTRTLRSLYWSFDQILFVGEEGSGDFFGYRLLPGDEERNDIYRWEHEDDSRSWFALSLSDYFTRRE